jgi:cell division protein FtsI (penicillin-binding protein 3)
VKPQPKLSRWVRLRVHIVAGLITLMLTLIGWKAYGLQIGDGERYRRLAERQHFRTIEVPGARGPIFDIQGRELAVSVDVDSVVADPRAVVDVTGTADALARALGMDPADLEAKLASRKRFIWIQRHVSEEQAAAVRALDLPGIDLRAEPRRFYPGRGLACSVLGFADIDGKGVDGVEASLDDLLSGKQETTEALRDGRGRTLLTGEIVPESGTSVTLTIDRSIQSFTERALAETVAHHRARAGTAIVIEVATGEVLAMANVPSWDPNDPSTLAERKARNRAVTDAYEVGSGMKVFTIAAALDAGVVRPGTWIDTSNGMLRIGAKVIRDSYRDESLDIGGILKRSSNVGTVRVAIKLGAERLYAALRAFGFGSPTDIELPGERSGLVRPPERWGKLRLATIAFGYGLTSTPLQVAAALAAIGNGGIYQEPRLVKRVTNADGEVVYEHKPVGRRVLREQTARTVTRMLGHVFDKGRNGGTARDIDVPGYKAGGKTGTARKIDPRTGTYSEERYLSSFIGLAPLDAPRIAILVIIDEPRGEDYYGGRVAAPAFARIVSETLRYLGVPAEKKEASGLGPQASGPEPEPDVAEEPMDLGPEIWNEPEEPLVDDPDGILIPDFEGMSMTRAVELAAKAGIALEVEGSGRAESQSPPAGSRTRPARVHVVFSE